MPLAASLTSAKSVRILESATMDVFMRPEKLIPADEAKVAHIQYRVPLERYELARAALSVNTMKEVEERTFDYFYTYECKDE